MCFCIQVIVERYIREKTLPLLDKTKFLVPFELTLGQFLCLLRYKYILLSHLAYLFKMHAEFIHHPLFLLFFVTFLGFVLSEIRLHWTPPRRCSSSWLRKACPACRPAWGRFILTTGTQMASYTSPTPRRRYLGRLHRQPGRPADNQGDDHVNLTSSCSDS